MYVVYLVYEQRLIFFIIIYVRDVDLWRSIKNTRVVITEGKIFHDRDRARPLRKKVASAAVGFIARFHLHPLRLVRGALLR